MNFTVVTAYLVGDTNEGVGEWVLVDTGIENLADFY